MKASPKSGTIGRREFQVEARHCVQFGDAMPAVLSTPALLWELEHAAIEALRPLLEAGEVSLGTEVELQHLAPTPPGRFVVCVAKVAAADGANVAFHLEARDEHEVIARGFHRRCVVRVSGFARRVAAKTAASVGQ